MGAYVGKGSGGGVVVGGMLVVVVVGVVVVVVGAVVVVVGRVVGEVGRGVVVRLPASVVGDAADVLAATTGASVVELVLVPLVMTVPRTSGAGTSVFSAEPDHGSTPAVSATTTTSRPTTSFENQR